MKLHRITLRNWRGVESRMTEFVGTGVTVVEGANESGKSSMVEALDTLISHLDDTKKREVAAIKAVHNDFGAEVEAEIETGPFRFTYFKRFHRKPATTLTITRPTSESLSGREAHERVRQMLEATLDSDLWSALRIEQGQELTQANLAEAKSLAAALDRAAGVTRTGEAEETLYAAAHKESDQYFTATGAPRKETTALQEKVRQLDAALTSDRDALLQLERDIARIAVLHRSSVAAKRALVDSRENEAKHAERLRDIERVAARVREKRTALDLAKRNHDETVRQAAERAALIQEDATADKAWRDLLSAEDLTGPAFATATAERDEAESALRLATDASDHAERAAFASQQEFELQRDSLDLATLRERNDRIARADAAAAAAAAILAVNAVSAEVLSKVQAAHLELEKSRAALAAGGPELRIRALSATTAIIDGASRTLAADEEVTHAVAGSLALVLPGVAEIEVRTGSSTANLRDAYDERNRDFADLCRRKRVLSVEHAVTEHAAWQAARRDVDTRDRVIAADLRDLSREQIAQKIANLEHRVAARLLARDVATPFVVAFEGAQEAHRLADLALKAARTARADAERKRDATRKETDRLGELRVKADLTRGIAENTAKEASRRLSTARAMVADADIEASVEAMSVALHEAERAHHIEVEIHNGLDPEAAALLAANAIATRERAETDTRAIDNERIELRARLKERGEAGLAERCDVTEALLTRARDELARRNVHAAAAKLLFDTLDAERANSRQAYVAPLREQIEKLGRVVYGGSFSVELNDALQISSRTLDGRTLPFDSLSGGAREQLGVIARLACALTVAGEGGVPVIFDDTLGNTDPARIEAMGALLALAGKSCQVIVLTCVPDRFRHIGGATVVRA